MTLSKSAPLRAARAPLDAESRGADPTAPDALRHKRPGWRDPRILVGLLILAGSVLLGTKLLAAADDTVGVWSLRTSLPSGSAVTAEDLQRTQIGFGSAGEADRYLSADQPVPTGLVLRRDVGAGELLPRHALGPRAAKVVEVPLSVEAQQVPDTVRQGSVVDVWVAPQTATTADRLANAERVLDNVVVISAPLAEQSLAPSGTRQVIVGVDEKTASSLGPALGRTLSGRVVLTRQG